MAKRPTDSTTPPKSAGKATPARAPRKSGRPTSAKRPSKPRAAKAKPEAAPKIETPRLRPMRPCPIWKPCR